MFESLDIAALNSIRAYAGPGAARLAGWLREPYGVWAVVSCMWTALRVGLGQARLSDVLVVLLRISFVAAFALNPATYNGHIAKTLRGMGTELTQAASTSPDVTNAAKTVDSAWDDTFETAKQFRERGRQSLFIDSAGWYISAGIVLAVAVIVCAVSGYLLLSAQLGLEIMILVGPLFLWAALYAPTRQMFAAWLGQSLGYVLATFMVSVTIALAFVIWKEAILNTGRNASMELSAVVEVGFVGLVCLGLVVSSAAAAAHLTQGVQIAAAGVAAGLQRSGLRMAGGLKSGLSRLRPRNVDMGATRMRQDVDAIKRAGSWLARAF